MNNKKTSLVIKTRVRAGSWNNHNRKPLVVKTRVRAGALGSGCPTNHNRRLLVVAGR